MIINENYYTSGALTVICILEASLRDQDTIGAT